MLGSIQGVFVGYWLMADAQLDLVGPKTMRSKRAESVQVGLPSSQSDRLDAQELTADWPRRCPRHDPTTRHREPSRKGFALFVGGSTAPIRRRAVHSLRLRRGSSTGAAATKTSTTTITIAVRGIDTKLLLAATLALSIASSFHLNHSFDDDLLYLNTLDLNIMSRALNVTRIHILFTTP
jgi:hypothetical protein